MFDYLSSQAKARELIKKYGRQISLIKAQYNAENQVYNPVMGKSEIMPGQLEVPPEEFPTYALFLAITKKWRKTFQSARYTIESSDSIALIPGDLDVIPMQNDRLGEWTILAIETMSPAGVVILYKCLVRK